MTLKLTERDKKLLVFLAIFLIIVGIGAGVIYPLFTWSKSLDEELSTQKQLQVENEQKVSRVITMEMGKKEMEQEIEQTRKEFYSMMDSDKIDKMLTEYALSRSVTVTNLDISMPKSGSYTQLADYSQGDSTNNTGDTEAGTPTYDGVYTASIQISMSGSQDALHRVCLGKQKPRGNHRSLSALHGLRALYGAGYRRVPATKRCSCRTSCTTSGVGTGSSANNYKLTR